MKYIAVEGCIGVGKTTVARLLTGKIQSHLVLERFEDNPFLKKFYEDPVKYALETELCFVLIHYHQLKEASELQKGDYIISDFCIEKDKIFANLNIKGEYFNLFKEFHNRLSNFLPQPDIMVCLHCTDELILQRIKERNREEETLIKADYFLKLNNYYEIFFKESSCKKINVSMNERDFLKDKSHILWLQNEIIKKLG